MQVAKLVAELDASPSEPQLGELTTTAGRPPAQMPERPTHEPLPDWLLRLPASADGKEARPSTSRTGPPTSCAYLIYVVW